MSHFTVMVIGRDPEKQLAPYNENKETPEYVKEQVTQDEMIRFYEHYSQKEQAKKGSTDVNIHMTPESFEQLYTRKGRDWNGNMWRKHSDGTWWEYSSYNPQSKWDWYVLGGRWSGHYITHLKKQPAQKMLMCEIEGFSTEEVKNFIEMARKDKTKFEKVVAKYNGKSEKIKKTVYDMIESIDNPPKTIDPWSKKGKSGVGNNETGIDAAKKGDIDFDAIRKKDEEEAATRWDTTHAGLKRILGERLNAAIESYEQWDNIRERYTAEDRDKARDYYHAQDVVRAYNKAFPDAHPFSGGITPFLINRERYIERAGESSFSTFAVLKDGKWYEKGDMGWWGMVSDEKDQDTWNKQVTELLKNLPDDTLISIYDCHI